MKYIYIMIFIIILLPTLVSCGDLGDFSDSGDSSEMTEETASTQYSDDLGEFDFEGYEFSLLTRLNPRYNSPINSEKETGEILNDAIYRRSRTLEERFNFTFKELLGEGDSNAVTAKARNSILAGDNEFDLITLHIAVTFPMAQEGLIHPITELPYVDFNKPYWNQELNSNLTVIGKQYFAFGAHDLSTYDFTRIILFNKAMIQEYSIESPYELVKSGKWTYDKFEEMSKTVTTDVNGDGVFNDRDIYGFLAADNQVLPNFWISAGVKSVEKDANDIPYSAMSDSRFIDVFDRIFAMTWDINTWFAPNIGDTDGKFESMFENGNGLFLDSTFYFINILRGMETDFGILPYPKYTEIQENYYTRIEGVASAVIPITANAASLERTSVILEALACESQITVIPVYYDVALKVRTTRDEESEEMLDIIFAHRVFDFGDGLWFGDIRNGIFQPMFRSNDRNLVSKLESMENKIQKLSDDAVEAFRKLD